MRMLKRALLIAGIAFIVAWFAAMVIVGMTHQDQWHMGKYSVTTQSERLWA